MDKVRQHVQFNTTDSLTGQEGSPWIHRRSLSQNKIRVCVGKVCEVCKECVSAMLKHSGTRFHQRCTTLKQTLGRICSYPSSDSSFEVLWDSSENKHLLAVLSLLTFTSHLFTLNPELNRLALRSLIYSNSCRLEGVSHMLKCTPAATCCSPLINLSEGAGDWMLAERHKGSGSWKGGVADLVCLTLKL